LLSDPSEVDLRRLTRQGTLLHRFAPQLQEQSVAKVPFPENLEREEGYASARRVRYVAADGLIG
jgi:hypothetical protein